VLRLVSSSTRPDDETRNKVSAVEKRLVDEYDYDPHSAREALKLRDHVAGARMISFPFKNLFLEARQMTVRSPPRPPGTSSSHGERGLAAPQPEGARGGEEQRCRSCWRTRT